MLVPTKPTTGEGQEADGLAVTADVVDPDFAAGEDPKVVIIVYALMADESAGEKEGQEPKAEDKMHRRFD